MSKHASNEGMSAAAHEGGKCVNVVIMSFPSKRKAECIAKDKTCSERVSESNEQTLLWQENNRPRMVSLEYVRILYRGKNVSDSP